jgi:4-hydroxy-tetrahydrodipicolinate reductase
MSADTRSQPLIRVVLIGVSGRMGQALLRAAAGFAQLLVTGAIASPGSLALGRDAGEVAGVGALNLTVSSDLAGALAQADVALDFSSAAVTRENLRACQRSRTPLLLGTTGFDAALGASFDAAAREIPLLIAANTSIGVALLTEVVRTAAQLLPHSFDIDVLDLHHRLKADAPSGTALALGRAAAAARGGALRPAGSPGSRAEGEIGFAMVRAGDLVGEHTVLFSGLGEQLSFTHRASERGVFARGALSAALWLASQPPGRYAMRDFLGLKTIT